MTDAEKQAILDKCPHGPECGECGVLVCPHRDFLHFHHEGCPACDGGAHSPDLKEEF